jgi:hypothetical protein
MSRVSHFFVSGCNPSLALLNITFETGGAIEFSLAGDPHNQGGYCLHTLFYA